MWSSEADSLFRLLRLFLENFHPSPSSPTHTYAHTHTTRPKTTTMLLQSATRAAALRSSAIRSTASPMACLPAIRPQMQQTRAASEHAIANPTLASIEKRWETMPPQEQADLWMQLRDRMKVDWHKMTIQEKKAGM